MSERIEDEAEFRRLLPIMLEIANVIGASFQADMLRRLVQSGGVARIMVVSEIDVDVVALARLVDRHAGGQIIDARVVDGEAS